MCKIENMNNKYILYILVLVVSSFFLSGCTVSQEKMDEYNQVIAEANLLLEAKEYSSAIEKLNNATQILPSGYAAYEKIVEILISKNRLEDTKRLIDESTSKLSDMDRSKLYILLGKKYYEEQDYTNALRCYQLSKGISDEVVNVDLETARVYLQLGDIEKAKELLNNDFEENFNTEAKLIYSYILSISDIQKAQSIIADIQPEEKWKDSYVQWEKVLKSLDKDELYNRAKLGKEYLDAGYPYLSILILEEKKENMQEYIDGLYLLGRAYYENGKYQKSIDTLEGVTVLSELNQYIYWLLARDYYMLNNSNEAFSYYDSSITYAGDTADVKLYQEYLNFLFDSNQTTKAEEVLRKAESIFKGEWINIYYIKLSYLTKQSEKTAYYSDRVEYEKLEGDYKKEYLYWKAKISIENSDLIEAKRTLDLYWELDKYDPRYNLLMSQLSFQEGKLEESRTFAKKAIEYDTERSVTDEAQKLLARVD